MTSTRPAGLSRLTSVLRPAGKTVNRWGLAGYLAMVGFLSGVAAIGLAMGDQLLRGPGRKAVRGLDIAEAGVFLAGAMLVAFCLVAVVLVMAGAHRRPWLSLLFVGVGVTGALAMATGLCVMMDRTEGMILCGCTGLLGGAMLAGGAMLSAVIHRRSAAS